MAKKTAPAAKSTQTPRPAARSSNEAAARRSEEQSASHVGRRVRVRAIRMGYYDDKRRRVDDVFIYTIGEHERKLPTWVEEADPSEPLRITSAPQALKQQHDELLASRYPQGTSIESEDDDNPLKA